MGNYGVKLRKPEELPDFDQPIDMEEKNVPAEDELSGKQIHSASPLPKTELFGRAHRHRPYGFIWVDYAWVVGIIWVEYVWTVDVVWANRV